MPGFSVKGEQAQRAKKIKAEYRRKHRWRVSDLENGPVSPQDFLQLQSAMRPEFTLAPAEVHHDQEVAYFAGKQTWNEITLVFYDAVGGGASDISARMYSWVTTVAEISQGNVNLPSAYKKTLILQSTDGSGSPDETWKLYGAWPTKSNWQNLDYKANDIQTVDITLKYDRAERQ